MGVGGQNDVSWELTDTGFCVRIVHSYVLSERYSLQACFQRSRLFATWNHVLHSSHSVCSFVEFAFHSIVFTFALIILCRDLVVARDDVSTLSSRMSEAMFSGRVAAMSLSRPVILLL